MSVGLIKPALDSTNDLLDTIRVGSFSVPGGQLVANVHSSQRPIGQNTSNWNRSVLMSVRSLAEEQIESKKILSVSRHSRRSKS